VVESPLFQPMERIVQIACVKLASGLTLSATDTREDLPVQALLVSMIEGMVGGEGIEPPTCGV
jgi:hypothetical protein